MAEGKQNKQKAKKYIYEKIYIQSKQKKNPTRANKH